MKVELKPFGIQHRLKDLSKKLVLFSVHVALFSICKRLTNGILFEMLSKLSKIKETIYFSKLGSLVQGDKYSSIPFYNCRCLG